MWKIDLSNTRIKKSMSIYRIYINACKRIRKLVYFTLKFTDSGCLQRKVFDVITINLIDIKRFF